MRLIEMLKIAVLYLPLLRDAFSTESAGVDTNDFDGALAILQVGVTDVTVDFKLQESDASSSGYVDITGAAITQIADDGDNVFVVIDVNLTPGTRKRYIRALLVAADGTNGANTSALLLLYKAGARPTTSGATEVVKV